MLKLILAKKNDKHEHYPANISKNKPIHEYYKKHIDTMLRNCYHVDTIKDI